MKRNHKARVIITWQKRNEITRSVAIQDSIHVRNLYETLSKAPGVVQTSMRMATKGERIR